MTEYTVIFTDDRVDGLELHWYGGGTFSFWSVDPVDRSVDLELEAYTSYYDPATDGPDCLAWAVSVADRRFAEYLEAVDA